MKIQNKYHLTYCTNIHPGESWKKIFLGLKKSIPIVKKNLSPKKSFGIGLRLSDLASRELTEKNNLTQFLDWLGKNNLYVFTINGFVYGGFHKQIVKDKVHQPDWTTRERVEYTLRMFNLLAQLLPDGMDGGISTSPLSYKLWHKKEGVEKIFELSAENIIKIANELRKIKNETGKILHLDIEPEPDGLIENSEETIKFFRKYLFGKKHEEIIREHIRVCYDICHFAVEYEKPAEVLRKFSEAGIQIGKVQVSSALKIIFCGDGDEKRKVSELLVPFAESTYLHQTVEKKGTGLTKFNDLPSALETIFNKGKMEWRIHYHVPVFMKTYNQLSSTQEDIFEVFSAWRKNNFTNHFEVETYTWDVLPRSERLPLEESISRELEWVQNNF